MIKALDVFYALFCALKWGFEALCIKNIDLGRVVAFCKFMLYSRINYFIY